MVLAPDVPNVYEANCPTRQVLDLIADKWTVLIIILLKDKPQRFSQLQRGIGGISQKMLAQTLRGLERDGLVVRTVYAEVPPRVEYKLTPVAQTLIEPIIAIRDWAESNINTIVHSQNQYDERHASQPQHV